MNNALYVRRLSLNLIRDLTGNQCSDLGRGLDSESLLYAIQISFFCCGRASYIITENETLHNCRCKCLAFTYKIFFQLDDFVQIFSIQTNTIN